jgi:hypothetical protein
VIHNDTRSTKCQMHFNLLGLAATSRFNWITFHRSAETASRCSESLWARWSGDQIPVKVRFSAPVQTGPWAHLASCTMGTGSFQAVKRPGFALTTHPYLALRLKKEYSYNSTTPLGLHGLFYDELSLFNFTATDSESTMKVTTRLDTQTAWNI